MPIFVRTYFVDDPKWNFQMDADNENSELKEKFHPRNKRSQSLTLLDCFLS